MRLGKLTRMTELFDVGIRVFIPVRFPWMFGRILRRRIEDVFSPVRQMEKLTEAMRTAKLLQASLH
ncbi:hypothetical protein D1641_18645 [Colidextribacter sp. OB.20]|nr:hypothetical protein [Colidextribacter sp. OB.20]